jgi:hypothetical protein
MERSYYEALRNRMTNQCSLIQLDTFSFPMGTGPLAWCWHKTCPFISEVMVNNKTQADQCLSFLPAFLEGYSVMRCASDYFAAYGPRDLSPWPIIAQKMYRLRRYFRLISMENFHSHVCIQISYNEE